MTKYLAFMLVLFVFFPYLKILPYVGGEVQPNAAIASLFLIVLMGKIVAKRVFFALMLVAVFSLAFVFVGSSVFYSVRGAYTYISFYLTTLAAYLYFKTYGELSYLFLRNVLLVYLIVGLVQLYLDPDFMHFLLVREKGYGGIGGRGVESLTSEPTYYGIILLLVFFYVLSSYDLTNSQKFRLNILTLVSLVFVSRSTTAIFGLAIYAISLIISRRMLSYILPAFVLLLVVIIGFEDVLVESRLFRVLGYLVDGGVRGLVDSDQSSNDRLLHVFFSLKGAVDNYFIPRGFDAWAGYVESQAMQGYHVDFVSTKQGKIFPFIGAVLFELGIVGFLLLFYIYYVLYKRYNGFDGLSATALLTYILFQALTVAFPLVPFILAFLLYQSELKSIEIMIERSD